MRQIAAATMQDAGQTGDVHGRGMQTWATLALHKIVVYIYIMLRVLVCMCLRVVARVCFILCGCERMCSDFERLLAISSCVCAAACPACEAAACPASASKAAEGGGEAPRLCCQPLRKALRC